MGSKKSPHFLHLALGTDLVSRAKQALINICVKLGIHHLIFFLALLLSPGACHVVTLSLYHSSVAFLLSSLGSLHVEESLIRKAPTLSASFQQPLAAARLCSRCSPVSMGCPPALFLLAQSGTHLRTRLCPPQTSSWLPTDACTDFQRHLRLPACFLSPLPLCTAAAPCRQGNLQGRVCLPSAS